ncbi:hypothetical protein GF324_10785 [bacterium]|nr:hypothetical protein [bacterium]
MGGTRRSCLTGLLLPLIACVAMSSSAKAAPVEPAYSDAYLDSMAIAQPPGSGRPFLYSSRDASCWYGSTERVPSDERTGFYNGRLRLWDDFLVTVDGEPLNRAEASVEVRPHQVSFQWPEGEELTVQLLGAEHSDLRFRFSGGEDAGPAGLFLVFPPDVQVRPPESPGDKAFLPFYLSTKDTVGLGGVAFCSETLPQLDRFQPTSGMSAFHQYMAGKAVHGVVFKESSFQVDLLYGVVPVLLKPRWREIQADPAALIAERKAWLLGEINRSYFRCGNDTINRAVNWAKVSLAQLWRGQQDGILPGLPWVDKSQGRDTFIALPGAALVTGKWKIAERNLSRFAYYQQQDPDNPDYGKIPTVARPDEDIYNAADITPWWVRELYDYGLYSGDTGLWLELWPHVVAATDGTLDKRTDETGYIVHGPADTWMEAVGPEGSWTPRDDRAVEIQALWLAQLEAAAAMGTVVRRRGSGKKGPDVDDRQLGRWLQTAQTLRQRFPSDFGLDRGVLADHINPDGSLDPKNRPNKLFALTVPLNPVFPPNDPNGARDELMRGVRNHMVYRWGVASLAQDDPDFHPHHESSATRLEAAFFNGAVHPMLSGAYKSADPDHGWGIARHEIQQILDWGCPGTLSEALDAVPREGHVRTVGAVSMALSLAEFLRSWQQDYLGIKPVMSRADGTLWNLDPRIPLDWMADPASEEGWIATAVVWIRGARVKVEYHRTGPEELTVAFDPLEDLYMPVTVSPYRTGRAEQGTALEGVATSRTYVFSMEDLPYPPGKPGEARAPDRSMPPPPHGNAPARESVTEGRGRPQPPAGWFKPHAFFLEAGGRTYLEPQATRER